MFIEHNRIFYLKGIVAASFFDSSRNCDVSKFAIYTNALKFTEWIEQPNPTCGTMSGSVSLIQGGSLASRDAFPWTVAVYYSVAPFSPSTNYDSLDLNTGTLISSRHVLTDAHFTVFSNYTVAPANNFKLFFGASDINQKTSAEVISSGVADIIVHEKYNNEKLPYEGNIAIMVAERIIEFSKHIQPVCLLPYNENSELIKGKSGYAAGWGRDENKQRTNKKKVIPMKLVGTSGCNSKYSGLPNVKFSKFFCATSAPSGVPCVNDLPLYIKTEDSWYLQAFLSMAHFKTDKTCNPDVPVLYEDFSFYAKWIKNKISA